jgi:integrase
VKRWVPWIGAYSGARVSEICQLRREDVVEIDGIWCMKIMPEAGSVKTSGSERIIPVHPALEESGFLKFALQKKTGPIFSELSPDKFGKRGGNGTKVIGRFVRQLGITDPRISPRLISPSIIFRKRKTHWSVQTGTCALRTTRPRT